MNSFFRDKRVSVVCHLILAAGVLPFLLLYHKSVSLLFINGHFNGFLDVVMYHITRLPELAYIIFVLTLALFTEKRTALAIAVAMSLAGILIVCFKHYLFSGFDRPSIWLNSYKVDFHHVDGIRMHTNGSFPSGHTLSAFCSLALVGFVSKNGWLQLFLFLLACLSGYSRVYVAQHYLMDAYAGAMIGFTIALSCTYLSNRMFKTPFWLSPLIAFKS